MLINMAFLILKFKSHEYIIKDIHYT